MLFSYDNIETPAVFIELDKLEENIAAMQVLADRHGLRLKPHAKTHKSLQIARRQIKSGAVGITVATVDEALVFMHPEFKSLTVSRPIVSSLTLDRLLKAARDNGLEVAVTIDSIEGVKLLLERAASLGYQPQVFLKIDVGLKRCGLNPESKDLIKLAGILNESQAVHFSGIMSHAGHAYGASSKEKIAEIAEFERTAMLEIKENLLAQDIPVETVTVGSTPTILAAESFEGIDEIRPGNYLFLDAFSPRTGVAATSDISLSVLATIVSTNEEFFITDAGSKTLSSDAGGHGLSVVKGFGVAYPVEHFLSEQYAMPVSALSEEHSKILKGKLELRPGNRVRIIPNHSCPVVNLAARLVVVDEEKIDYWPVDAGVGAKLP